MSTTLQLEKEQEETASFEGERYDRQGAEKEDLIHRIMDRYWLDKASMDQSYTRFRNRTPRDYWDDSNKRFNYYKLKDNKKHGWQNNVFDPITHDKTIAIIAGIAARRFGVKVKPRRQRTFRAKIQSLILSTVYEYTEQNEVDGDVTHFFDMLEATTKGTCIRFEGFDRKEIRKKKLNTVDELTGEVTFTETTEIEEGIRTDRVELNDFIPGNPYEFDMKKQTHCYWRAVISHSEFERDWGKWKEADKVNPGMVLTHEEPFFETNSNIDADQVEIIRYFDVVTDEYHIIANGVLLTELISPLRREDKKLPFYKIVFEPFEEAFFWGRSFPDKIMQLQDVNNTLLNAMLDQLYLSIFKPILTSSFNNITQDELYAGSVIQVDDINEIKEMDRSGPESVAFQMFGLVQQRIDVGSVDPIKQGQVGGAKTATEIERAVQAAGEIQGLFQAFAKWGVRDKALLRLGTIMQYYFRPRAGSKNKVFNEFIVENVKLINNRTGVQTVRIKSKGKLSPKDEFGFSNKLFGENAQATEESEIIEVSPEFMTEFEYHTELVVEDLRVTEALKKAFTREFVSVALQRPDLFDEQYAAKQFAEVMEQDPDEALAQPGNKLDLFSDLPGGGPENGGDLANAVNPAQKAGIPSLKSLIGSTNVGTGTNQPDVGGV